jgi:aryl-alcohol dehydrogenase-like predicted oxidoreductase
MQFNRLGSSELVVSRVCLGSMTWGEQNTEAEGHAQMDMAFERGVNFIDTAEMYATPPRRETQGESERIIGSWLKRRKRRDDVILASKITGRGPKWIRDGRGISPGELELALHASLRNLVTDHIDLYQLHWPNRGSYHFGQHWQFAPEFDRTEAIDDMKRVLEALSGYIQAGKIRHIGLSNETAWGIMHYLRLAEQMGLPRMVSIQNEYSLLCRLFEPDLHEISMAESFPLLAWSPLATGLLTGKYAGGVIPDGSRWATLGGKAPRNFPRSHAAVSAYQAVAHSHGLSLPRMALAFVNSRPFVGSTIIGATNLTQLETALDAFDLRLSEGVLADIARTHREHPLPY